MTPERFRDIVLLFAPLIIGIIFLILGLLYQNLVFIGVGAGLLGVPGLTESVRGTSGASKSVG